MRKLILISAFAAASILASFSASVSAQAGDRSLILAANDAPAAASTTAPAATTAPAEAKPEAAPAETAKPEGKKHASKPQKTHARHYEGDEAKARRIAARYGVYW
jgi:outer membrane biosynthesis protein TonB